MARSESTFASRFSYAIWLRHLVMGEPPSYAAIGRAVGGMTGQAVSAWTIREEPPANWKVHDPLSRFLHVDKGWLIEGKGTIPGGSLWRVWLDPTRALRPELVDADAAGKPTPVHPSVHRGTLAEAEAREREIQERLGRRSSAGKRRRSGGSKHD